jgi:TetR/AcrR family transcriptional regulator of autoinduction and epiphytic fitness
VDQSSHTTNARTLRKREQILTGARQLFLTRGYAGTSTDAIAKTIGISKETLYAYYPNKEALFAAVLQHVMDLLVDDQLAEIEHTILTHTATFQQELVDLAQRIIHTTMQPDYLALVRIIFAESTRVPQLATLFRSTIPMQGLAYLSRLLEQLQQQKVIQVENVEAAARMFIGSLLTYVFIDGLMLVDEQPRQPDLSHITLLVNLFVKAVLPDATNVHDHAGG